MIGMVTHLTIYGRPGTIAPRVGIVPDEVMPMGELRAESKSDAPTFRQMTPHVVHVGAKLS